ncbi:MAG: four helix bundle protein [Ignavibacteriota bacterium]|jgi:four helix bundle protein|nr:MAG: four helix bundle protein [Chlorobiota bacterium]MBE7476312.1 four helix bundle protein [Ignavibacteriales bacterium]MBL1124206.1 four helix bundle protein [Ignavibacteriota bacterium]MCE7857574.1 four helix bundle protein [Ignavibacteria bacterium CHB3]MCZ7614566.1 four helix bundle protein [Ignavibacteriaceae bacterium]
MRDFRKLKVWEKAHAITLKIYKVTEKYPREELYGLTSQIRRACVSIPTNIAEGCVRSSDADFSRFLYIALGSTSELEYLILLSMDLKFINAELHIELNNEINEIKKMLISMIQKLKA